MALDPNHMFYGATDPDFIREEIARVIAMSNGRFDFSVGEMVSGGGRTSAVPVSITDTKTKQTIQLEMLGAGVSSIFADENSLGYAIGSGVNIERGYSWFRNEGGLKTREDYSPIEAMYNRLLYSFTTSEPNKRGGRSAQAQFIESFSSGGTYFQNNQRYRVAGGLPYVTQAETAGQASTWARYSTGTVIDDSIYNDDINQMLSGGRGFGSAVFFDQEHNALITPEYLDMTPLVGRGGNPALATQFETEYFGKPRDFFGRRSEALPVETLASGEVRPLTPGQIGGSNPWVMADVTRRNEQGPRAGLQINAAVPLGGAFVYPGGGFLDPRAVGNDITSFAIPVYDRSTQQMDLSAELLNTLSPITKKQWDAGESGIFMDTSLIGRTFQPGQNIPYMHIRTPGDNGQEMVVSHTVGERPMTVNDLLLNLAPDVNPNVVSELKNAGIPVDIRGEISSSGVVSAGVLSGLQWVNPSFKNFGKTHVMANNVFDSDQMNQLGGVNIGLVTDVKVGEHAMLEFLVGMGAQKAQGFLGEFAQSLPKSIGGGLQRSVQNGVNLDAINQLFASQDRNFASEVYSFFRSGAKDQQTNQNWLQKYGIGITSGTVSLGHISKYERDAMMENVKMAAEMRARQDPNRSVSDYMNLFRQSVSIRKDRNMDSYHVKQTGEFMVGPLVSTMRPEYTGGSNTGFDVMQNMMASGYGTFASELGLNLTEGVTHSNPRTQAWLHLGGAKLASEYGRDYPATAMTRNDIFDIREFLDTLPKETIQNNALTLKALGKWWGERMGTDDLVAMDFGKDVYMPDPRAGANLDYLNSSGDMSISRTSDSYMGAMWGVLDAAENVQEGQPMADAVAAPVFGFLGQYSQFKSKSDLLKTLFGAQVPGAISGRYKGNRLLQSNEVLMSDERLYALFRDQLNIGDEENPLGHKRFRDLKADIAAAGGLPGLLFRDPVLEAGEPGLPGALPAKIVTTDMMKARHPLLARLGAFDDRDIQVSSALSEYMIGDEDADPYRLYSTISRQGGRWRGTSDAQLIKDVAAFNQPGHMQSRIRAIRQRRLAGMLPGEYDQFHGLSAMTEQVDKMMGYMAGNDPAFIDSTAKTVTKSEISAMMQTNNRALASRGTAYQTYLRGLQSVVATSGDPGYDEAGLYNKSMVQYQLALDSLRDTTAPELMLQTLRFQEGGQGGVKMSYRDTKDIWHDINNMDELRNHLISAFSSVEAMDDDLLGAWLSKSSANASEISNYVSGIRDQMLSKNPDLTRQQLGARVSRLLKTATGSDGKPLVSNDTLASKFFMGVASESWLYKNPKGLTGVGSDAMFAGSSIKDWAGMTGPQRTIFQTLSRQGVPDPVAMKMAAQAAMGNTSPYLKNILKEFGWKADIAGSDVLDPSYLPGGIKGSVSPSALNTKSSVDTFLVNKAVQSQLWGVSEETQAGVEFEQATQEQYGDEWLRQEPAKGHFKWLPVSGVMDLYNPDTGDIIDIKQAKAFDESFIPQLAAYHHVTGRRGRVGVHTRAGLRWLTDEELAPYTEEKLYEMGLLSKGMQAEADSLFPLLSGEIASTTPQKLNPNEPDFVAQIRTMRGIRLDAEASGVRATPLTRSGRSALRTSAELTKLRGDGGGGRKPPIRRTAGGFADDDDNRFSQMLEQILGRIGESKFDYFGSGWGGWRVESEEDAQDVAERAGGYAGAFSALSEVFEDSSRPGLKSAGAGIRVDRKNGESYMGAVARTMSSAMQSGDMETFSRMASIVNNDPAFKQLSRMVSIRRGVSKLVGKASNLLTPDSAEMESITAFNEQSGDVHAVSDISGMLKGAGLLKPEQMDKNYLEALDKVAEASLERAKAEKEYTKSIGTATEQQQALNVEVKRRLEQAAKHTVSAAAAVARGGVAGSEAEMKSYQADALSHEAAAAGYTRQAMMAEKEMSGISGTPLGGFLNQASNAAFSGWQLMYLSRMANIVKGQVGFGEAEAFAEQGRMRSATQYMFGVSGESFVSPDARIARARAGSASGGLTSIMTDMAERTGPIGGLLRGVVTAGGAGWALGTGQIGRALTSGINALGTALGTFGAGIGSEGLFAAGGAMAGVGSLSGPLALIAMAGAAGINAYGHYRNPDLAMINAAERGGLNKAWSLMGADLAKSDLNPYLAPGLSYEEYASQSTKDTISRAQDVMGGGAFSYVGAGPGDLIDVTGQSLSSANVSRMESDLALIRKGAGSKLQETLAGASKGYLGGLATKLARDDSFAAIGDEAQMASLIAIKALQGGQILNTDKFADAYQSMGLEGLQNVNAYLAQQGFGQQAIEGGAMLFTGLYAGVGEQERNAINMTTRAGLSKQMRGQWGYGSSTYDQIAFLREASQYVSGPQGENFVAASQAFGQANMFGGGAYTQDLLKSPMFQAYNWGPENYYDYSRAMAGAGMAASASQNLASGGANFATVQRASGLTTISGLQSALQLGSMAGQRAMYGLGSNWSTFDANVVAMAGGQLNSAQSLVSGGLGWQGAGMIAATAQTQQQAQALSGALQYSQPSMAMAMSLGMDPFQTASNMGYNISPSGASFAQLTNMRVQQIDGQTGIYGQFYTNPQESANFGRLEALAKENGVYGTRGWESFVQGGERGMQIDTLKASMRNSGLAAARAAVSFAFTTGVGLDQYHTIDPRTGKEFNIPEGGAWGIQERQMNLSNRQQQWNFNMQEQQMAMQSSQFYENQGFNRQQQIMQRGWTVEDWAYQDQTRGLQWQWKQEDFQENNRFLTGRQRRISERQMGRETIMHNLESEQIDKTRERQEKIWDAEDKRFEMTMRHYEEQKNLQEQNLEKMKEFYAESKKLQEESFELQKAQFIEMNKLQADAIGDQTAMIEQLIALMGGDDQGRVLYNQASTSYSSEDLKQIEAMDPARYKDIMAARHLAGADSAEGGALSEWNNDVLTSLQTIAEQTAKPQQIHLKVQLPSGEFRTFVLDVVEGELSAYATKSYVDTKYTGAWKPYH